MDTGDGDNKSSNESPPSAQATMESTGKKGKGGKKPQDGDSAPANPAAKLTPSMAESLLELNPALRSELAGMDKEKAVEALRQMNISDLLTGLSVNPKNQKDMASFKFWQTQPVIRFDDRESKEPDGPIKVIDPDKVSREPDSLVEGFEWVTLDIDDEAELKELYELLANHYVEDGNAMFRFNYSPAFLNWCVILCSSLLLGII